LKPEGLLRCRKSAPISQRLVNAVSQRLSHEKHIHDVPKSCLRHCIEGISEVVADSIDLLSLSMGFMRDEMHFWHVNIFTSTLPAPTLPWF